MRFEWRDLIRAGLQRTKNVPVLIQRLAVVADRQAITTTSVRVWCKFHLAVKVVSPGGYGRISKLLVWMCLAVWIVLPSGVFNCW